MLKHGPKTASRRMVVKTTLAGQRSGMGEFWLLKRLGIESRYRGQEGSGWEMKGIFCLLVRGTALEEAETRPPGASHTVSRLVRHDNAENRGKTRGCAARPIDCATRPCVEFRHGKKNQIALCAQFPA